MGRREDHYQRIADRNKEFGVGKERTGGVQERVASDLDAWLDRLNADEIQEFADYMHTREEMQAKKAKWLRQFGPQRERREAERAGEIEARQEPPPEFD